MHERERSNHKKQQASKKKRREEKSSKNRLELGGQEKVVKIITTKRLEVSQ